MKLKYNKQTTGSVVTVTLGLTNLSTREKKAIRILGAPEVVFEEAYDTSGTTVSIHTNVADFNSLQPFVFNGTIDTIGDVLEEANSLIMSVHETLEEVMSELMLTYREVENLTSSNSSGEIPIRDGYCHVGCPDQDEDKQ